MADSTRVFVPSSDGKPYFGFRKADGEHKRSFTLAALSMTGHLVWSEKDGKVTGYGEGSDTDFASIVGNSAYRHWTKTRGWVRGGKLTPDGESNVELSFEGKAGLRALPGLVTAYRKALKTGALRNDAGDVIEHFYSDVELPGSKPTPKAAAKAPQTAPKATAKAKATTVAKPTRKGRSAAQAKPKGLVMITPKAKA